jgi:hypothetical protein
VERALPEELPLVLEVRAPGLSATYISHATPTPSRNRALTWRP